MKPKPSNLEEVADRIIKELSVVKTVGESEGLQYAIKANIVFFVKKYLKSACEFYLRYKDKPTLLLKEHPEYESTEFLVELDENFKEDFNDFMKKYNEWLFKLAFKDVLKEVK